MAVTGGTYTFTVSSPIRFRIGSFTIDVFLNAAVSTSAIGGASNNQRSTAQSISGSFEAIGPTASRGAVVGVINGLSNGSLSDYYSFSLAAGQTVSLWPSRIKRRDRDDQCFAVEFQRHDARHRHSTDHECRRRIENFTATTTGTYYADVTGVNSNIKYVLVVTRGPISISRRIAAKRRRNNITGTAGVLGAILVRCADRLVRHQSRRRRRVDAANVHVRRRHGRRNSSIRCNRRFSFTVPRHADRLGQRQPEPIDRRRCNRGRHLFRRSDRRQRQHAASISSAIRSTRSRRRFRSRPSRRVRRTRPFRKCRSCSTKRCRACRCPICR